MTKGEQGQREVARERIPEFKTREEAAEWFDSHDLADHWDELKPIDVRFAKNLSGSVQVRLGASALVKLRQEAAAEGIAPSTLARRWILEHLGG